MISAIRSFFKGYANFSGRSKRSEFWWFWILNTLFFLPFYYLIFSDLNSVDPVMAGAIISFYVILFIVEFVPLLALTVRRLRDVGFHWAYIFIVFVPFGGLALLVMLAMPSQRFREKLIENSEKNKENTEDSLFEDMVRKY